MEAAVEYWARSQVFQDAKLNIFAIAIKAAESRVPISRRAVGLRSNPTAVVRIREKETQPW